MKASPAIINRLLAAYQLTGATVHEPQSGYRNTSYRLSLASGAQANLILYKSEPGILRLIQAANHTSDYLAAHGLPTRQTRSRILKLQSAIKAGGTRTTYACLYNYLPGNTIPWEAYTKDHVKLLGLSLSHIHAALAQLNVENRQTLVDVAGECRTLLTRMQHYFAQPNVQSALHAKLHLALSPTTLPAACATLSLAAAEPHHQPLHLDFVRGNILFGDTHDHPKTPLHLNDLAITGILDFEKTAIGPRIFDIARTLAFLLVDVKTKTPAQIYKYFLHSGYNKRGAITTPSLDLLQALINFYLLHDFYKFLRHNPYEYLPQNEHFIRTQHLLLHRNLLT